MRDNNLWNPRLIVAMPDHVHLIADIPRTVGIGRSIRLYKAKTAHAGQIKWQRSAFDHRIRNASAVRAKSVLLTAAFKARGFCPNLIYAGPLIARRFLVKDH